MEIEEKLADRLIITVDGQVQEIPLFVYPSAPDLKIDDKIDFGIVVMANKVISKQISIVNEGSKIGEFKLIYNGSKPLNIVPSEGFVYPLSSVPIQIEYVAHEAQSIKEKCNVNFEGQDPFYITVCGDVVKRSLELLNIDSEEGEQLRCIKFPYTYYGSDRSEMALLFNNSPEKIQFVAILQEDAVGQESGSHIQMTASGINPKECTNPLTSIFTMYPNQGKLGPYEKIPILFRFSPRWNSPKQAFMKTLESPLQQTFAVFIKVQIVGSGTDADSEIESLETKEDSLIKSQQLEVAITGTAAPVLIEMEPSTIDFGNTYENEQKIEKFILYNRSSLLSCLVNFPREAHFIINPKSIRITPNEKLVINVVFSPKQYGNFKTKQTIKVSSYVIDPENPFVECEKTIYEENINFFGTCITGQKSDQPINSLKNKNKYAIETCFSDLGNKPQTGPIAAYVTPDAFASGGVKGSKLFRCSDANLHPYNNRTAMIAFPNDRATSIKPSEQTKEYRTIFKRIKRYNYVDSDYAYNDEEMRLIKQHKDKYQTLIRKQQLLKKISRLNSKFAAYEDNLNLGIIPGNGIKPPKLDASQIVKERIEKSKADTDFTLLSSKELKQSDKVMNITKSHKFNAIPTTNEEKAQCSKVLTPQQLHKIIIGPSTINFGDICIRSTSNKEIAVVNNLDQIIHVSILIDCKELRQSSPLSQIIPAKTKSNFPLVFESNKRGKFQRNLSYLINGYYQNHIIVLGNVVLNQLELSTDCILLTSSSIYPPDSGVRNTVTLTNSLNSATEFLWEPVFNSSSGIAFSIRPKEGVVDAFSKLDCEVVFHPSFMAPSEGDFILRIPGNEENNADDITQDSALSDTQNLCFNEKSNLTLHCIANLGNPHVTFQSRRVIFGNIPINMTTSRTAIIINTGTRHAYFRIIPDELYEKYAGMIISPLKGSVPVGGQVELTIKYLPISLTKFDCSVPIVIRGWKELELKISGAVIIPHIEILQKRLDFSGVPVGSEKNFNFNLINKSQCRAEVEFDFTEYKDFTISCFDSSENLKSIIKDEEGLYLVLLKPLEDKSCQLIFNPKEVASYDFPLCIRINKVEIAPYSGGGRTTNSIVSSKNTVKPIHQTGSESISEQATDINLKTTDGSNLNRIVTATATRRLIEISENIFHFQSLSSESQSNKKLLISNNTEQEIELCLKFSSASWRYGTNSSSNLKPLPKLQNIPFTFSRNSELVCNGEDFIIMLYTLGETVEIDIKFEPDIPGYYVGEFLLFVNNNYDCPFQRIIINGSLESSMLICQPKHLTFIPAPLNIEVSLDFEILAVNFKSQTFMHVNLPEIKIPGSSETYQPFRCTFLTSNEISPMCPDSQMTSIRGTLSFCSNIPINARSVVQFSTDCGVIKYVNLSATADNCQLSWQNFYNKHQAEYHIVCDEGKHLEGTESVKKFNSSDFGEPQLKLLNTRGIHALIEDHQSLQSRNSTTVTSSNLEESTVTYEETFSENETPFLGTPLAHRDGALNNIGEKVKHKLSVTPSAKQQNKNVESSMGSTCEIRSSVMSDKNFPFHQNINLRLPKDNMDFITTESTLNKDFDIPSFYDTELLLIVQRWFTMHGLPGNLHPVNVPITFRSSLQKRFGYQQMCQKSENMDNTGLKTDSRDLYDMILYLSGKQILGISSTLTLPTNPIERMFHIYIQHSTLIAFIESQGGQLAQVTPEQLMELDEYELWHSVSCPGLSDKDEKPTQYDSNSFEKVSKKAWTTLLLQILKVFILNKVTYKSYKQSLQIFQGKDPILDVQLSPTVSNCYSLNERILLAWLNYLYESFRNKCWPTNSSNEFGTKMSTPVSRWIINFDNDFMDSLILATAIGAYVPYMIDQHFKYMYSNPQNPEQCLHNALKIVSSLKDIGIEYDIQAIDIVDPNPVMMIMFSLHLFQTLPLYLPKSEITFTGLLHEQVTKQILISNPINKTLCYECIIIGVDSSDFCSPKGNIVNLTRKGSIKWPIVFKSRFLRSAEATVMFVGRKSGSTIPANLIFTVKSKVTSIQPTKMEKISGQCYVLKKISLKINSPYNKSGTFKIRLLETSDSSKSIKDTSVENKSVEQSQGKLLISKKTTLDAIKPQNKLRAFFCHCESITINDKIGYLDLFYLPFHMGVKTCTIIFSNDEIGEFVQGVEATAELPEPTVIENENELNKSTVMVSPTEAANYGSEINESTIYWKCEVGSFVNESLSIPINNPHKQSALHTAAKLHLSSEEVSRRQITGTLNSTSLLMTAVNVLTLSNEDQASVSNKISKNTIDTKYSNKEKLINFDVEVDSAFFTTPLIIQIPDPLQFISKDTSRTNKSSNSGTVDIPIKFHASSPGVYPCNIVLKGPDDIRLFRIEATVIPDGNLSQIYFKTPLQETLIQNIPIVNKTKQDWPLRATIAGSSLSFSGPDFIMAKALSVSQYALQFKPIKEGRVTSKLSLLNESDGSEHIFELFGEGQSPLALENFYIECTVGEIITKSLEIPNSTRKKHLFTVESDLDWLILGEDSISVLPGQSSTYEFSVVPKRSGKFTGILAFVSGRKKIIEYDSDGDEVVDVYNEELENGLPENKDLGIYRIWYSITIDCNAGPPRQIFDINCHCLQTVIINIPINNPLTQSELKLESQIYGQNLRGNDSIIVKSGCTENYSLQFAPSAIGEFDGRLVFFNESIGEFWFQLNLKAESPREEFIPPKNCEIGKWSFIEIPLRNVDQNQNLSIVLEISNQKCFGINIQDMEWFDQINQCFIISPSSEQNLSIKFTPYEIGANAHQCILTVKSKLLGDWKFYLSGIGLPPKSNEMMKISAESGCNTTLLIPFHNPLLEPVLIDIEIIENFENDFSTDVDTVEFGSVFKLLLKNNRKLKLESKQTMEIPISFAPREMRKYQADCNVVMKKKSGQPIMSDEDFNSLNISTSENCPINNQKNVLIWNFPIQGIPEIYVSSNVFTTPLVQGPLRFDTKERVEFHLSGLLRHRDKRNNALIDYEESNQIPQKEFSEDFIIDLKVTSVDNGDNIDSVTLNEYVKLSLVKSIDPHDNEETLLQFDIQFKPLRKFRLNAELSITFMSGGVWKFPIRFVAHECEPDDEVVIESIGLNKPVSVKFNLTSKTSYELPFKAYFLKGGDPDFSVYPDSGILPPVDNSTDSKLSGLQLIVTWLPKSYSRSKGAKLIIQTEMMEWIYKFIGTPPQYVIPESGSMIKSNFDNGVDREKNVNYKRKNFLRKNMELLSTAVSSPIKGAPLFPRIV